MVNPSARSAYIAPRLTPLMICWRRTSPKSISDQSSTNHARYSNHSGLRDFRCHADVRSLRVQAVRRTRLVLVVLEDAHDLSEEVSVRVEGQLTLQRLELRLLHGIADVVPVRRCTGRDDALDGVDHDERGVIRRDGVVVIR